MKKLRNIILVLLIVLAATVPCFATTLNNPDLPRIVDYPGLLSDAEEQVLQDRIDAITEKYGFDVLIFILDNHGADAVITDHDQYDEEFIEYVWDYNGFGVGPENSGWAFFLCMENRYFLEDSCGAAQYYHTYDTGNIIEDFMYKYFSEGRYYEGFLAGLSELDALFELGPEKYVETTYSPIVDPTPGPQPEPVVRSFWDKLKAGLTGGGLIGALAGFIGMGSAKGSMKSIFRASGASAYEDEGSFRIYRSNDILMNVRTQTVMKSQESSGGSTHHSGGSSYHGSHTSSGGGSHTSSGRHF